MFSSRPIWWRYPGAEPASGRARHIVVVTDVEGSLFASGGHSLFDERAGLDFLAAHGIPLVINSRRTRAEIQRLNQTLGLLTPFVSEHGSALFLPRGCFPFVPDKTEQVVSGDVVAFGKAHADIAERLRMACCDAGVEIVAFSEMSIEEVAGELGISNFEAQLVKHREYSEVFRFVDEDDAALRRVFNALRRRGLWSVHYGRHHLVSATPDCAESLRTLRMLWRLAWGEHVMIGLGSSEGDLAWLQHVDVPVIVPNHNAATVAGHALAKLPAAHVTRWTGRRGWSEAILSHVGMLLTPLGMPVAEHVERKALEQ